MKWHYFKPDPRFHIAIREDLKGKFFHVPRSLPDWPPLPNRATTFATRIVEVLVSYRPFSFIIKI
jgi:hypothetical protein